MHKVSAEEYFERAMGQANTGNKEGAVLLLQDAIMARPDYAEAYNNRGVFLQMLGNNFDAWLCHERAIELKPQVVEHYNNSGSALINMGLLDEAIKRFEKALEIQPVFSEAEMNLGNIYRLKDDQAKAIEHYRKSVAARPQYVDAHLNLTFALLQEGHYEEGWREYEWRWKSNQLPPRGLAIPPWNGERGKRVLIYGEQGLGDMIQFARFAPIVQKEYDCQVFIEVRRPLKRLIETVGGIEGVISFGDKLPEVDYAIPMMSVPRVLGTTVATIPAKVPYLSVDSKGVDLWRRKVDTSLPKGLRVGICWAGQSRTINPIAMAVDARRSTTLDSFAPLGLVSGVVWVSLQKGPPSSQLRTPPRGMTILDPEEEIEDFYDTAALASCLDLVISVDTSVVHMAGALGVPTWLLSRFDGCWRWMGARTDSPWYPSIRQFRQPGIGDWDTMMNQVAGALEEFVEQRTQKVA